MYDFIKDNEDRIKTLLGDSLTDQYWDKFVTASKQEWSGSWTLTDLERESGSLTLGQYESGSDTSWFIQYTGSLDS